MSFPKLSPRDDIVSTPILVFPERSHGVCSTQIGFLDERTTHFLCASSRAPGATESAAWVRASSSRALWCLLRAITNEENERYFQKKMFCEYIYDGHNKRDDKGVLEKMEKKEPLTFFVPHFFLTKKRSSFCLDISLSLSLSLSLGHREKKKKKNTNDFEDCCPATTTT